MPDALYVDLACKTGFFLYTAVMSIRMRHTRSHTANRRSHHGLALPRMSKCAHCGAAHRRHMACSACGQYRGKAVSSVVKSLDRKVARVQSKTKATEHVDETTENREVAKV